MIAIIVLGMWAHTGSMPLLVVVESNSMQHDDSGEIGTIDAGDLVMVHSPEKRDIITWAEATQESSIHYGYETLGMPGDVIIYKRNGEDVSTPIIHRALFEIVVGETVPHNSEGDCDEGILWEDECVISWTVPGTDQVNVANISIEFNGQGLVLILAMELQRLTDKFGLDSKSIHHATPASLLWETTTIVVMTKEYSHSLKESLRL